MLAEYALIIETSISQGSLAQLAIGITARLANKIAKVVEPLAFGAFANRYPISRDHAIGAGETLGSVLNKDLTCIASCTGSLSIDTLCTIIGTGKTLFSATCVSECAW